MKIIELLDSDGDPVGRYLAGFREIDGSALWTPDPDRAMRFSEDEALKAVRDLKPTFSDGSSTRAIGIHS